MKKSVLMIIKIKKLSNESFEINTAVKQIMDVKNKYKDGD
jgi:hypothetical protein